MKGIRKERELTGNRVIPFAQESQFFHRRAIKGLDDNRLPQALAFVRRAIELEPDNISYQLDMADIYTEMGCFEESNRILFSLVFQEDAPAECYYGMACNYMGLHDARRAQEHLMQYLQIDQAGQYAEDAEDMLDYLEETELFLENENPAYTLAIQGKEALDGGQYEEAEEKLKRAVDLDDELVFARNNYALTLYCMDRLEEAVAQALATVEKFPKNAHALCNLAIFLHEKGVLERPEELLEEAIALRDPDPESLHKIALTACELAKHEQAYKVLSQLIQKAPYDVKMLHYMAAACMNTGRLQKARAYWARALRLQPDDSVIAYYMKWVQGLLQKKIGGAYPIPYHFQVPHQEIMRRVRLMNTIVSQGPEAALDAWQERGEFEQTILWGVQARDPAIQQAMLSLVATFKDKMAEKVLRDFLLMEQESDEIKREVLGMLKQMGAQEPYVAYLEGALGEVRVSVLSVEGELPMIYQQVLEDAIAGMRTMRGGAWVQGMVKLWMEYVSSLGGHLPVIRKTKGWSAALEYAISVRMGEPLDLSELCIQRGVTEATVRACAKKILDTSRSKGSNKE